MSTIILKLYDILKTDLHLSEGKAREFAEAIAENNNNDYSVQLINKDIASLKQHIENKFATKDDNKSTKMDAWYFYYFGNNDIRIVCRCFI